MRGFFGEEFGGLQLEFKSVYSMILKNRCRKEEGLIGVIVSEGGVGPGLSLHVLSIGMPKQNISHDYLRRKIVLKKLKLKIKKKIKKNFF